jgi:hypothetical protein
MHRDPAHVVHVANPQHTLEEVAQRAILSEVEAGKEISKQVAIPECLRLSRQPTPINGNP